MRPNGRFCKGSHGHITGYQADAGWDGRRAPPPQYLVEGGEDPDRLLQTVDVSMIKTRDIDRLIKLRGVT